MADRRLQVVAGGIGVVAILVLGHLVSVPEPDWSGPYRVPVAVGEPAELRYATVTAAEPAGSKVADVNGVLMESPGVWLAVEVDVVVRDRTSALAHAVVVAQDGRQFEVSGARASFLTGAMPPGIPVSVDVLVELPVEAAAGASLQLGLNPDDRYDSLAVIDLGITPEEAAQWAETTDPVTAGLARWAEVEP